MAFFAGDALEAIGCRCEEEKNQGDFICPVFYQDRLGTNTGTGQRKKNAVHGPCRAMAQLIAALAAERRVVVVCAAPSVRAAVVLAVTKHACFWAIFYPKTGQFTRTGSGRNIA